MSADTINLSPASKHCAGVDLPRSPMLTAPCSNFGPGPTLHEELSNVRNVPSALPGAAHSTRFHSASPAASLPECTGGKSAVCLCFINLHTHIQTRRHMRSCMQHAHTHRHMPGLRANQIKTGSQGGSCKLVQPPPVASSQRGLNAWWGGCKVIKRGEKSKPFPLSMSAGLTGAVNVRISSAVSTQRER